MRFIFVTGGVVSSVGKGIAAASIGTLLQSRGFKIVLRKMDPYLNIDPGTMSPYEHGEVFVTEDGAETDLDLGHYERFTGLNCSKGDSISAGQVLERVLEEERNGRYLGKTVQVVPHVTNAIQKALLHDLPTDVDFVICEIGGTVGDIEANPFLEAIRQFAHKKSRGDVVFVHVTLLPYLRSSKELKTKPTQHSIKELQRAGITPNILICRSEVSISKSHIQKLSLFCNVGEEDVIPALDAASLSQVIVNFADCNLDERILNYFSTHSSSPIVPKTKFVAPVNLDFWREISQKQSSGKIKNPKNTALKVAIVGKYVKNKDAYISLQAALSHASLALNREVDFQWIEAAKLENTSTEEMLAGVSGILVPGGYGKRGIEGKIAALKYGRENNIPVLGICLGAQLMTVEALRNLVGLSNVGSAEFDTYEHYAVSLIESWQEKDQKTTHRSGHDPVGGTMRLGAFDCNLTESTLAHKIYKSSTISERHRHRYEINMSYAGELNKHNFIISALSPDGKLPEIVEYSKHPFYIGVQFHPEFKSRLFNPHPLFIAFLKAQC